jgi:hypothetical protein
VSSCRTSTGGAPHDQHATDPAIQPDIGGEVDTAVSLAVEDGRISRIFAVRNPQKLAGLAGVSALTRSVLTGPGRRHRTPR